VAAELLKVIDDNKEELDKISNDTPINLPVLGQTTLGKLVDYLPFYIKLTKKKSVRDMIPDEIHGAIMAFAEASGAYEPPPIKQTLKDLDIPAAEVAKMAHFLQKKGWSPVQISKQMDLPKITVVRLLQTYAHKNFISKAYDNVYSWLQQRVEHQLEQKLKLFTNIETDLQNEKPPGDAKKE